MRKSKSKLEDTLIDEKDHYSEEENLSYEEDYEQNGICEFVPLGTPVAEFRFDASILPSDEPMLKEQPTEIVSSSKIVNPAPKFNSLDNRTLRLQAFGKTPTIDGESFELSRTFMFRRSTVRILNRLKAEDPDENIYLSSIVDTALRYYADYILNKNFSKC